MLFEGAVPGPEQAQSHEAAGGVSAASAEVNEVSVVGEVRASRAQTVLRLASGKTVAVPTALLLGGNEERASAPVEPGADAEGMMTIPLLAEHAEFGKETVTTGTVRLHKGIEAFSESVTLPLTRTGWEVERTTIGQLFAERPEVRQEGDVTVFPLVEERLVARREYFLLEEVRVRRVEVTTDRTATVELKRDTLTVERDGVSDAARS